MRVIACGKISIGTRNGKRMRIKKLRDFIRAEVAKINKYQRTPGKVFKSDFSAGLMQGKFDILMDIDLKFKIGAIYKK